MSSPKIDVRRAPVPEASICCTGEIAAPEPPGRSPILPPARTKTDTHSEKGDPTIMEVNEDNTSVFTLIH